MLPTINQTLREAAKRLTRLLKNSDQAWLETELLYSHVLKNLRIDLITHGDRSPSSHQQKKFENLIRRRLHHEPLAYLMGSQMFCGREFLVDHRVLIPRPETELLIQRAIPLLAKETSVVSSVETRLGEVVVWDVGTGSGAVAITIKKERPDVTVIASDIDERALTLAKKNARRLKAKDIKFIHADLLDKKIEDVLSSKHFLVIANLPYLPLSDKKKLAPDVVRFEPTQALFTKEDGLYLIHRLLHQLSDFITHNSLRITHYIFLIEFDPPQASRLMLLAKIYFPQASITIHKDLCGRNRFLEIS
ncbi:MAG: peptide chain release factor N(5)-glutamine methyltransferase [Candidatus Uhrbacteria bacterium]|nr:peptide chain release factor N(5)-glutamine methyltransferase [Candidatus Uhrbacteria bacterium]